MKAKKHLYPLRFLEVRVTVISRTGRIVEAFEYCAVDASEHALSLFNRRFSALLPKYIPSSSVVSTEVRDSKSFIGMPSPVIYCGVDRVEWAISALCCALLSQFLSYGK